MSVTAVLVDCNNEVVGERPLCGRAYLLPMLPQRETDLDVKRPHRADIVDRVFEIDGRSASGEYIYRESYWSLAWCKCVNGILPRRL